ncbi:MAG: DNA polymerase III subunit beta [Verrucomicrobia bacterium GWF2_51_19]|nr:MAG: DNA polymerase III subunit beta [Verrucomicrobia bacterium GWF2_51_19]HCJ11666.1 DNA polymerase III subunit beta [Opitutae bacterium]
MKFKIQKEAFVSGLQQVSNIVGSRATMPILSNVLIVAENNRLSLTTTNLDIGIMCCVRAQVESAGSITLPVKKLFSIIKSLPQSEVEVELSGGNQTRITSGSSTFRILGIEREEFPPLPSFDDEYRFSMAQADLLMMLKNVSYAQSLDENRYILNGVYFILSDKSITTVATDGRRLAVAEHAFTESVGRTGQFILPAKSVAELEHLLGQGEKVSISYSDRQVAFNVSVKEEANQKGLMDTVYIVSKVVEGNYPNYNQVVPKETHQRIKVERELFLECTQRAALVVSDKNNSIRIKISKNSMELLGSSAEYGQSHESMAIDYSGPDTQIAFNPQFLMEPLRALTKDEVFLEFKDELSPGVVKTLDSFMCVIMPLRLNAKE